MVQQQDFFYFSSEFLPTFLPTFCPHFFHFFPHFFQFFSQFFFRLFPRFFFPWSSLLGPNFFDPHHVCFVSLFLSMTTMEIMYIAPKLLLSKRVSKQAGRCKLPSAYFGQNALKIGLKSNFPNNTMPLLKSFHIWKSLFLIFS